MFSMAIKPLLQWPTRRTSGARSEASSQAANNIIKEGLLNGELGTAWALQNIDHHRVKLDNLGRKKVDGRELDAIEYVSKSNGEMTIRLYFDPETHHHVMTVYTVAAGSHHRAY